MKLFYVSLVLLLFVQVSEGREKAAAAQRPILYSYLSGPEIDARLQQAYGNRFTIKNARNQPGLTPPRMTSVTFPRYGGFTGPGGDLLVAFIATAKGYVENPVILQTANPRMNSLVRDMVRKWQCEPARLNGVPVATIVPWDLGFTRIR